GMPLKRGVRRRHGGAREGDRAACIAAERYLAHRDGELPAAEVEQRHLGESLEPEKTAPEVTRDGVTAQGNTLYAMFTASSRPTSPRRSQCQKSSEPVITVA